MTSKQQVQLSVIVPTLNEAAGLEKHLQALQKLRADIPGMELLLVDGGSREELIDRYVPWMLRPLFKRFAHLRDDGEEIELFASGGKRYLSFVLRKPGLAVGS